MATQATVVSLGPVPMSLGKKLGNLAGLLLPFVGLLIAVPLLWNHQVDAFDLGVMAAMYAITGFGITVGYHRLLTHNAFQTFRPLKYLLAICGAMALEGPPVSWVADHRKHHAHTDTEGDPHSPWVGRGPSRLERFKGFCHAHMLWLFSSQGSIEQRYAPDLYEDRGMRLIGRRYIWLVVLSMAIPATLGWLAHGGFAGAARGLVWGGAVRAFFLLHATFAINSVCHIFGRRRFNIEDRSTNVWWLGLFTMGESYHHNHHAFPRSAVHGLRWYEIDLSAALIWVLEKLGLIWNVVRIAPERQKAKEAAA